MTAFIAEKGTKENLEPFLFDNIQGSAIEHVQFKKKWKKNHFCGLIWK